MYKQASKLNLRITTVKGQLSVEQLWNLSMNDLSSAIKEVKKILNKVDETELSFLSSESTVDVVNQLRFDILKDVYLTKKSELEESKDRAANKAHNQKILALIAKKEEESLESMSKEELEKLLK